MDNISFLNKTWHYCQNDQSKANELAEQLRLPVVVSSLLLQRGISTIEEARGFLYPSLENLPTPFLMKDMEKGVKLFEQAVKKGKPIIIFGDYDVDGVTGAAVLARFFDELGLFYRCIHPDRFEDGYGLKSTIINKFNLENKGLVVTVDCGVSDYDEIKQLMNDGWEVIVTDHHQPPEKLPPANAVINPCRNDCNFPFSELAGVGVAFYFVMGIRAHFVKSGLWKNGEIPNLKKLLDLVAIGSISDLVPLIDINRILVKAGLDVLKNTQNLGLQELLSKCNIPRGEEVVSDDIAFQIGPRLNAAGRMGQAARASELLFTNDTIRAKELADEIEQENYHRRELTFKLIEEAKNVAANIDCQKSCLVLHGKNWHQGLIGIVSSKLVDIYNKPVVIFSGNGVLKGSARSVPGINIHQVFCECEGHIIEYGGHSAAAGLSLQEDNLPYFEKCIDQIVASKNKEHDKIPLHIGLELENSSGLHDLEVAGNLLQPYGQGNPEPIYSLSQQCVLKNMKMIGKDTNHLRFSVRINGRWINGIGFGFGAAYQKIDSTQKAKIAFTLRRNRYNGFSKLQVQLEDLKI